MITKEAKAELLLWKENDRNLNASGKKLNTKTFFEACLFPDASSSGYGGYMEMHMSSSETGKNEGYQKGYCEPQDVGLFVSLEVIREIPMNLGEVRKEKGNQKVYYSPSMWAYVFPRKWREYGHNGTPGSGERRMPTGQ